METLEKKKRSNFQNTRKFQKMKNSANMKETLKTGDIFSVQITALGANNIGVAELKNGYTVVIPNTKVGEQVEVKVEKIWFGSGSSGVRSIVAKPTKNFSISTSAEEKNINTLKFDFKVGQKFQTTILKKGPKNSGLISFTENFVVIVPNAKMGENVCVEIQKIKENYALGKIVEPQSKSFFEQTENSSFRTKEAFLGQEYNVMIPFLSKTVKNCFVFKFQGKILFLKKEFGVQPEEKVKIQIQKSTENFLFARIVEICPFSNEEKKERMKEKVQKMIRSSLHFGEKTLRCHANMRKFLWYRKKGLFSQKNSFHSYGKDWKKPMVKRGRHIFNLFKTQRCFDEALKQLAKYAAKGRTFLFVGTKKPAASLIAKTALLSKTSFFVNTRWLGGMLTNWKTILKSLAQIRPILKQKQGILQKILEKRQKIQRRLIFKVSLLKKKSQKFMMKGKYLTRQILLSKKSFLERGKKFLEFKNSILSTSFSLANASKNLKQKKSSLAKQIVQLEQGALKLFKQKQQLRTLVEANIQKYKECEQFFILGKELFQLKTSFEKQGKKQFVAVSFETFTSPSFSGNQSIPSPSTEILKKMISLFSNLRQTEMNFEAKSEKNTNRAKTSEILSTTPSEGSTLLFSKFLQKFTNFVPFFEKSMEILNERLCHQEKLFQTLTKTFDEISNVLKTLKNLYARTNSQLSLVSSKFALQQKNIQKLFVNFRQFVAEQRLVRFFPKFRYLPTSNTKMYETVEFFMKKFVDPKLSYPMEQIYDQKLKFTSKKIAATRKQKWQRLEKYFGGITKMAKMNTNQISKNVAIIFGQQEELNALHECKKLGMKIFTVVDTNCNPKYADYIIPANDDSRNSTKYILGEMLTYIRLGQKLREKIALRGKTQQMKKRRNFSFA